MSDLVLNALQRKRAQVEQLGNETQAKRIGKAIAAREKANRKAENLSDLNKAELLELAAERDIEGRTSMNKAELVEALAEED